MPEPDVSLVPESSGLEDLILKARAFAAASKAASTRRAIGSDWRDFDGSGKEHRLLSLPVSPEAVALYLTDRTSALAPQTLTRRLTAITQVHRAAGFVNTLSPASTKQPVVGSVLQGVRRIKGVAAHGKEALLTEQIRALTATFGDDLQGLRDRSLLLVGFAGAFRRSEIVAVDHSGLEFTEQRIGHADREVEDGPGGGRPGGWDSVWGGSGNLPGAGARPLAGSIGHQRGTGLRGRRPDGKSGAQPDAPGFRSLHY